MNSSRIKQNSIFWKTWFIDNEWFTSLSLESFNTYKLKMFFFRQIATWFFIFQQTKSRKNTPLWNLQAVFISTDWVGWWFSRFFAIFFVIWRHFLLQNLFFIFCQISDFPCLVSSSVAELMLEFSSLQEILIVIFFVDWIFKVFKDLLVVCLQFYLIFKAKKPFRLVWSW